MASSSLHHDSPSNSLFDLPLLPYTSEERLTLLEQYQVKSQKIFESHRIQLCAQKEEIGKIQTLLKSLFVQ